MSNDPVAVEDFGTMWKFIIQQKSTLVCFKEGSDDMIGVNLNLVSSKNDHFLEEINKQNQSVNSKLLIDILGLMYKDFDTYEHYDVDEYLTSFGLVVDRKYRDRRIGEQFLRSRKPFCEAFGIKLTSTIFTSNFSNKIADNVGFKLDRVLSYADIRNDYPEFNLPPINSDLLTLKTLVF
ncbi:uncharacterized protein LOC129573786 [Sitodiplosis mosellana]|uniref:uncharacterized protein LOC129573786 n=1 Tax=Sitodiplosis mosellana TaxID=263140 RepID=UPI002443B4C1|nr:uncharacterized protein LOC129573786 [Sitodiplosis mosellana]